MHPASFEKFKSKTTINNTQNKNKIKKERKRERERTGKTQAGNDKSYSDSS